MTSKRRAAPDDDTAGLDEAPARPGTSTPYLLVLDDSTSRTFRLPREGVVTVGRGEAVELRLDDAGVSRAHLRLSVARGGVWAEDLGSQNGTRLNGQPLARKTALASGDTLDLGRTALVFHGGTPAVPATVQAAREVPAGERPMLVADEAMVRIAGLIERVAASDLPVLVVGETGVGKELAARAVHAASPRRGKQLLALNVAAVQESVFESELFGYERGAFTGAAQAKPGLFEVASGGTVFLDEVGELSHASQVKLLRALDSKRILRVGGLEERPIDVRVVAATNRDLGAEVERGAFRRDLYFRLSGATIHLPPLRDRPRELELLARAFLAEACAKLGRATPSMSPAFLERLFAHSFPGNVRELRNVMEFLAATAGAGPLGRAELDERLGRAASGAPAAVAAPTPSTPSADEPAAFRPIDEEVRDLERRRMEAALLAARGNQKSAAALIGMPLRTFQTKAKLYGLGSKLRRSP
jgi:transcriptional regulator with GAF, ATPase, and Fis domain